MRTQETLARVLPPAPARVADIGGGPGAYAVWLAGRGYAVDLLDLVPVHVEQARQRFAEHGFEPARALCGDARALPFASSSHDALLLMGPMYHLPRREDRTAALREAWRALRPGGTLVVAVISRFASLLDGFFSGFIDDPVFESIVGQDLATGRHENPTDDPSYFTTAYFHHPEDVGPELEASGFADVRLFGVEGPFWCLPDFDAKWSVGGTRDRILRYARALETDRSLLGMSAHILATARRPEVPA